MERVKGIEPSSSAWEAGALPLCYTRGIRYNIQQLFDLSRGNLYFFKEFQIDKREKTLDFSE